MTNLQAFLWILAGVGSSLLIPVIRQLAFPSGGAAKGVSFAARVWPIARPYLFLGILSVLLALVTLAVAMSNGVTFGRWHQGFLVGYFS